MLDTDKRRFLVILTGIADYYGKELSEGVISLYWQGLKQYDIGAVEKALWLHTQNPDSGQFMPKIADVTKHLQGRTEDQAAMAWAKVDKAVRHVGTYQDVVFDDPIIHRAVSDLGGWVWLGNQTDDEWPFIAKKFESLYRGYRTQGGVTDYPPQLTGIANAHNSKEGQRRNPPVLIGDKQKAHQVLEGGTDKPLLPIHRAVQLLGAA